MMGLLKNTLGENQQSIPNLAQKTQNLNQDNHYFSTDRILGSDIFALQRPQTNQTANKKYRVASKFVTSIDTQNKQKVQRNSNNYEQTSVQGLNKKTYDHYDINMFDQQDDKSSKIPKNFIVSTLSQNDSKEMSHHNYQNNQVEEIHQIQTLEVEDQGINTREFMSLRNQHNNKVERNEGIINLKLQNSSNKIQISQKQHQLESLAKFSSSFQFCNLYFINHIQKTSMVPNVEKDKLDYEKTIVDKIKFDNIQDQEEIKKFKLLLMKEIEESKYLNEVLTRRIQRVKEILNVFEIRIEFDENLCLKQADVEDLRKLVQQLISQISNTSLTELNLRMKERELLALKSEHNSVKHKFDILQKERNFLLQQVSMLEDNNNRQEEKLKQQKIDIHNEKRKNEFMSRRILDMEKSLSAMAEEFNQQVKSQTNNKKSINELNEITEFEEGVPKNKVSLSPLSPLQRKNPLGQVNKPNLDQNRMRQVLAALNKQNESIKKELNLYKKQFNEKVEDIEYLNSQIKRLQSKVNFGVKSMFENKFKEILNRQSNQDENIEQIPDEEGQQSNQMDYGLQSMLNKQMQRISLLNVNQSRQDKNQEMSLWEKDSRTDNLTRSQQKILDQLYEQGVQNFIQAARKDVNYDPLAYLEIMSQQYLSYKLYSDSQSFLINFILYSQANQFQETIEVQSEFNDTERLISFFRSKLQGFFNCQSVVLWVSDLSQKKLFTYQSSKKITKKNAQELEILNYVMENKKILILKKRSEIVFHSAYDEQSEKQFYKDEDRQNLMILPIISDQTGQVIGVLEMINFKIQNNHSRAIITQDMQKFAIILSKYAASILTKDSFESVKKMELNLREKFQSFSNQCLSCTNINQLYLVIKKAILEIFNSQNLHLLIKIGKDQIMVIQDTDQQNLEQGNIGICGDYFQREQKRKVIVKNSYEDPRFNMKVDINVSNQILLVPILLQKQSENETEVIGLLEFENNNYRVDFKETQNMISGKPQNSSPTKSSTLSINKNEQYLKDGILANQIHGLSLFIGTVIDYIQRKT
eukprot:403344755